MSMVAALSASASGVPSSARSPRIDLGLELAQQLGWELALAAHLGEQLALGLERLDLGLGGLGPVVGMARGLL
jgi:hypothetical protein